MNGKEYDLIGGDGKQYGPFSVQELNDYLNQGRANLQSPVRESGTQEEWCPISEVLGGRAKETFDELRDAILFSDRRLRVGRAFAEGSSLFTKHMGILIGASLLFMVILIASSLVPLIGGIVELCLVGPLTGGLFILILKLIRTNSAGISDLFEGFKESFGLLLGVGIAQWFIGIIAALPGVILIGAGFFMSADGIDFEAEDGLPIFLERSLTNPFLVLGFLVLIALGWGAYAAMYFVLPLAADRGFGFLQCFSLGCRVSLRNFFRISLVFFAGGLVTLISLVPLGLGLIFSIPWFFAVLTQAYEQMFSPETSAYEQ